jgi:hypothetical protein
VSVSFHFAFDLVEPTELAGDAHLYVEACPGKRRTGKLERAETRHTQAKRRR